MFGELVKSIVIFVAVFTVSIIASAYVLYFVGMVASLTASAILGLKGVKLAQIFAWIGVGAVVYIFAKVIGNNINGIDAHHIEMDSEELAKLIEENERE